MARKRHQGKIYDKERTKKKLISAVGKILVKDGYSAIRINKIESVSGVTKKLIYDYFGGLNGLVKAYLNQVDFWKIAEQNINAQKNVLNVEKGFLFNFLMNNFEYLFNSPEMQKVILWGISEKNKTIRALTDERENVGEVIFQEADRIFDNTEIDFRATMLVMVSSIYYTVLHIKTNGSKMCGIDMSNKEGQKRVFNAMEKILELLYEFANKGKNTK